MNPHYIIDGYNIIHQIPKFQKGIDYNLEYARNMLISFIRAYQSSRKLKITLVFDGAQIGYVDNRAQSTQKLEIIYSTSPEKADPVIKRILKKINNKKNVTLVSADNDLINFYKQNNAKVISPDEFYHIAGKHPAQDQIDQKFDFDISKNELDEWLKIFEEDKGD